ncbi:MAG: patatin family protein [Peptostreptococcaceae bacterium]|nr:patatin family protein [Peptostreptococcaceae bacterium]
MKKGLVVEGGGMRAVFVCGCMDALLEHDIEMDYVIGVSAGIANAASYISKQKGRAIAVATEFSNDKRYMGFRNFLDPKNKSYFGIDFMFRVIPETLSPFDYEQFDKFKGEVIAVISNVETGKAEYRDLMKDPFRDDVLIASCSLPMMFPVRKIQGKKYLDGGLCDPMPIRQAIKDGCDRILVISTREKEYRKKPEMMDRAAIRLLKEHKNFVNAIVRRPHVYNYCMDIVDHLEKEDRIKVIRPHDTKDFSRTEKDVEKMMQLYQEGYDLVESRIEELKEYFGI